MKTVLLSTSSLWNSGDDYIRQGIMNLCNFKEEIRIIWWNRGYGISNSYANDLSINLPLIDYFIVAGTPEWVNKNIHIYKYCLKHNIPFSLIGVGTDSYVKENMKLFKKLASSQLCEYALARDNYAYKAFKNIGFKNVDLSIDPAFYLNTIDTGDNKKYNILGWRKQFWSNYADYNLPFFIKNKKALINYTKSKVNDFLKVNKKKRKLYNQYLIDVFNSMSSPKIVTVHDNREIEEAENLFGKENVFYSSDPWQIYKLYSKASFYVGSRIHGAIPALLHGANIHLIYTSSKAQVVENSINILSKHEKDLKEYLNLTYFNPYEQNKIPQNSQEIDTNKLNRAIQKEMNQINSKLTRLEILSRMLK